MKTGLSINPLLLSIMAQAAEIVKSETSIAPAVIEEHGGVSKIFVGDHPFNSDHTKILTLDPQILKHPLLTSKARASIETYTFGKTFNGVVVNSEKESAAALSAPAVKINWDPQWEAVPQWIVAFINHPQRKASVWMNVEYEDLPSLNEKWCHLSVQLGWAWWLNPPKTTTDLKRFLELSKPFWRFWFTHLKSDQWVWPWSNILLKDCVDTYHAGVSLPRFWVSDARHKTLWAQIEDEAWQSLALVVGGETHLKNLSASVHEWISKNGIVPPQ